MRTFFFISLLFAFCTAEAQNVNLTVFAQGLGSPIGIENAGDDRLFVLERAGFVRIVTASGTLVNSPFLNIDSKVIATGGFSEQGLLGLAFHPDYTNNGYFFVHYTDLDGDGQISRFSVMADDPDRADANSELKIMTIAQPYQNHNGGDLKFGPDGYLYIGLGDGGSGGDPQGFGQQTTTWLGKMLRIDVNNSSVAQPYAVPADNPFVSDANVLDEIWSIGLRNPWRYSFDRETGDLYIGDVGQDAYAEVDMEPAGSAGGLNYGWRCYEGDHTYNTNNCADISTFEFPIHEYAHGSGIGNSCSITGGFVYRGCEYADLYGKYIYGDFCDGSMWLLSRDGTGAWSNVAANANVQGSWSGFGEGYDGSLYVASMLNGNLYKIEGNEGFQITFVSLDNYTEVVTADLPPITGYQWYLNDEPIAGATNNGYDFAQTGNYYVEVTTVNGCVIASEVMNIIPSAINELEGVSDLSIFPNPFDAAFELKLTTEGIQEFDMRLINVDGKTVWSGVWKTSGTAQKKIDAADLAPGVYFLELKTANGKLVQRVTKQ